MRTTWLDGLDGGRWRKGPHVKECKQPQKLEEARIYRFYPRASKRNAELMTSYFQSSETHITLLTSRTVR